MADNGQQGAGSETDTFSNPQWDTGVSSDMNSQGAEVDTFDSQEVILPEDQGDSSEDEGQGGKQEDAKEADDEKESKAAEKKETELLDDQEDEDKDGEGDSKGEGDEDKSTEEDDESDPEEATDPEPKGKTIRVKEGDKSLDISEEATVAVKVKGKKEFITIAELKQNFSGKKVWDQEFAKVEETKKTLETERKSFDASRADTRAHFEKIGEKLHKAYNDPEADPLEAMEYLLALSGQDVLTYRKKVMDHYGTLAAEFGNLSPAEQQLYWTKMENEVLRNSQTNRSKADEDRKASEQRTQKAAEARSQYGVSEQDYEAARSEIEKLGADMDLVSQDQISKYAATKPLVEKAEGVCEQFEEDLSTDEMDKLISVTADTMFKHNNLTEVEAVKIAAKSLGYEIEDIDEEVEKINKKAVEKKSRLGDSDGSGKRVGKKREAEHVESFDDFEADQYNYG